MGSTFRKRMSPRGGQLPRLAEERQLALGSPRSTEMSEPTWTEPMVPPLAYSVSSAAAALGMSEYSVYEMVRANRLPHVRIGRRILIPSKMLDAWLASAGSWAPADTL